jgi:hypothetical protein
MVDFNIDFNVEVEDSIELTSFLGSVCIQDEVFGRLARISLIVLMHRFYKEVSDAMQGVCSPLNG